MIRHNWRRQRDGSLDRDLAAALRRLELPALYCVWPYKIIKCTARTMAKATQNVKPLRCCPLGSGWAKQLAQSAIAQDTLIAIASMTVRTNGCNNESIPRSAWKCRLPEAPRRLSWLNFSSPFGNRAPPDGIPQNQRDRAVLRRVAVNIPMKREWE